MNFPKNVGIKVNENGKNGRGGKAGFARGEVGKCTGRGRNCTGASWNRTGGLGGLWMISPRRGRFAAVFQGNRPEKRFPVEKWAAVSAQWPGTGGFSEGVQTWFRAGRPRQASASGVFMREGLPFQLLSRPGLVQLLDVVPEGLVDAHVHAARQKGVDVIIVEVHMDGAVGNALDLLHRLVEGADDGLVIVAVLDLFLGGQADVVDDVVDLDAEGAVFVDGGFSGPVEQVEGQTVAVFPRGGPSSPGSAGNTGSGSGARSPRRRYGPRRCIFDVGFRGEVGDVEGFKVFLKDSAVIFMPVMACMSFSAGGRPRPGFSGPPTPCIPRWRRWRCCSASCRRCPASGCRSAGGEPSS